MELLINNFPIDFSLEQEKTLFDIVESIKEWAKERDLVFLQVEIDEDMFPIEEVPEMSLSDIKIINCIVQSKSDVVFSTIDEGIAYSSRVIEFIDSFLDHSHADEADIQNLGMGIEWLVEVFYKIMGLLELDAATLKYKDKTFEGYLDELKSVNDNLVSDKNDDRKKLLGESKELFTGLSDIFRMILLSEEMRLLIVKSIDSPDVLIMSLKEIKEKLPESLKNIEEVAIAFQTGKDSEGAEGLQGFIDFMFRYTRTCYQVAPVFGIDLSMIKVNDISLEDKNREIQDMLNETIEVMENNDIISLSDILEYEIRPLMEDIDQYMDELIVEISNE